MNANSVLSCVLTFVTTKVLLSRKSPGLISKGLTCDKIKKGILDRVAI